MGREASRPEILEMIESSDGWECVHFTDPGDSAGLDALKSRGFYVARVAGSVLRSDAELFEALARAFAFPDYFGHNWDALDECLADLDMWIPDARGFVLVIDHVGAAGFTRTLAVLIEIWLSLAQEWSADGKPFHLVGLLEGYNAAWMEALSVFDREGET